MEIENDVTLKVALLSDLFRGPLAEQKLTARLVEARAHGAQLALLPELPLDPWVPATRLARVEDCEEPGGPRHRIFADAARAAGVGVVGGAIVQDPATGKRHNTALVFDARGTLVSSYRKVHLPDEDGFWEGCHYEPGADAAAPIQGFALPLGVQLCSDINRPVGCHLLGAQGAMAILAPRAAESAHHDRWNLVFRANALTSATYVLSVNRPHPELGVGLGGPSIAVAPDGRVLVETTDPLAIVELSRAVAVAARRSYPGYLAVRADMYARAWSEVAAPRA